MTVNIATCSFQSYVKRVLSTITYGQIQTRLMTTKFKAGQNTLLQVCHFANSMSSRLQSLHGWYLNYLGMSYLHNDAPGGEIIHRNLTSVNGELLQCTVKCGLWTGQDRT